MTIPPRLIGALISLTGVAILLGIFGLPSIHMILFASIMCGVALGIILIVLGLAILIDP